MGSLKPLFPSLFVCGLCACSSAVPPEPVVKTVRVEVPIPQPVFCAAAVPARSPLPIAKLNPSSSPEETVREYAATVDILEGAVAARDRIIQGCAKP
jgi:hypothetical protein